jgi:hypothetical protein
VDRRFYVNTFGGKKNAMPLNQLDETSRNFLLRVYEQTEGDPARQVSMYTIGTDLALDREAASRVAEQLIGSEMVEIRTLSGAIGITDAAAQEIDALGLGRSQAAGGFVGLGGAALVGPEARKSVNHATAEIKRCAGSLGLDFERLTELTADLKTIDGQLESPRPKTAIVRECFRSLAQVLQAAEGEPTLVALVERLTKE